MEADCIIKRVRTPQELEQITQLVEEYLKTIPYDLSFQQVQKKLRDMPGKYVPDSGGELLVAYCGATPAGCVAVRQLTTQGGAACCEMKRLYVRPSYRNRSIGSHLVREIVRVARELKYDIMRLDSLRQFQSATKLYEGEGFKEIANYNGNPIAEAVFYERRLDI